MRIEDLAMGGLILAYLLAIWSNQTILKSCYPVLEEDNQLGIGIIGLVVSILLFALLLNFLGYARLFFNSWYWATLIGMGVGAIRILNSSNYSGVSWATIGVVGLNAFALYSNTKDFWFVIIVNLLYFFTFIVARLGDCLK